MSIGPFDNQDGRGLAGLGNGLQDYMQMQQRAMSKDVYLLQAEAMANAVARNSIPRPDPAINPVLLLTGEDE